MAINKIKILILTKSADGGTGTFVLSFIKIKRFFSKKHLKVKALVLEKPSYRKTFNDIVFCHSKYQYPYDQKISLGGLWVFINDFLWLKKNIVDFNPDVVVGVDLYSNLLIQIVKVFFFLEFKTVLCVRINLVDTLINKSSSFLCFVLNFMVGFFYNKASSVVCTSKQLAKATYKNFKLKKLPLVIYNGLDSNPENPPQKRINKNCLVISAGRLVEQKDFFTLIKSFVLVKSKLPMAKLWIVGDGPLKKDLLRFSHSLGLESTISFLGWKNNIMSVLQKADLFVLSSKREGFGWVLIEAMAAGLPIISTNAPYGPQEVINNGKYGILIPVKDNQAMTKAIINLLTNKEKYSYYAKKSLERVRFFSEVKMLEQYKKAILNLTKEK